VRGDLHILDERDPLRVLHATHLLHRSRTRNRNHHDAGRRSLALKRRKRHAECVPQDDLLERNLLIPEPQHG